VWDVALLAQGLETGDEAVDSYHLWKEDVRLLKEYGCNAYRFSVSWSRVKPMGGKDDPVNEKGIGYYNDLVSNPLLSCSFISAFCVLPSFSFPLNSDFPPLHLDLVSIIPACDRNQIDALLEANITPYITLFHWDLPQPLQDRYKGFRAPNKAAIVEDFVAYAELLFERFGDRVKNWITLNEVSLSVPGE
jgi:beta-glucosidase